MIVLGIDTSTPHSGVALVGPGGLMGARTAHSEKAASRIAVPAVRELMVEAGLQWADIGAVAVARGPGSFTGVRVGLSIAKALCEGGSPPLVAVSTLAALAWRAWGGEDVDAVIPMLNARKGEVYAAVYTVAGEGLDLAAGIECALSPAELIARWPGRALVAGDGWDTFPAEFAAVAGRAVLAAEDRRHPHPEAVAFLGREAALRGEFADPATLGPAYLREASVSTPKAKRER